MTRLPCSRAAALFSLFLFLLPALASGEGRDPTQADVLFKQGRQAMEAGNYPLACERFAGSHRLDPAVGTALNLAACEERIGKLTSARKHWQEAIDWLANTNDRRLAFAKQRAAAVDDRIPQITFAAPQGAPDDTRIELDGVEIARKSWANARRLDPGKHVLVVTATGWPRRQIDLDLADGQEKQIDIGPGAATDNDAEIAPLPVASSGSGRRTAGWIVGGVGAASLVVAIITGVKILGNKGTVEEHCNAMTKICDQEGFDAGNSNNTLMPVNTATWIIGAVGLGVGGYLLWTGRDSAARATTVAPTVISGGFGLGMAGRF